MRTASTGAILAWGVLLVCLHGCGGGGGGGGGSSPPMFSVNTTSLSFTAADPNGPTPASQTIVATVSGTVSGQLFFVAQLTGTGVVNVPTFAPPANDSSSATVAVVSPGQLGRGTFSSTITVRACVNDPSCLTGQLPGSPQIINVSYAISGPVIADSVQPHVIPAGATGSVMIRGSGLTGTTGVTFGATPAAAFTVLNDSLVTATYPATLTAGSLPVMVAGSSQPFTASVVAVGPQTYAAATLAYPQQPAHVIAALFDAERQVLYVAASFATNNNASTAANQLWQYTYSGGTWNGPAVLAIGYLRDIALPGDGTKLDVLTDTSVLEYDAAAPTTATRTVTAPFAVANAHGPGSQYLARFAFANDGNALVSTADWGAPSAAHAYLYGVAAGSFTDLNSIAYQFSYGTDGSGASLIASGDGSTVVGAGGTPGFNAPVATYNSVTGVFAGSQTGLDQLTDEPTAIDTAGDRIIFTDGTESLVCGAGPATLAYLPGPPGGVAVRVVLVNPQGTRAYVLYSDATLHTFDLSAPAAGAPWNFPEIGAGVAQPIPAITSPTLRTAVTPDGSTLFIAGDAGVAVIPAPN